VMRRDASRAEDFARRHGVKRWTTDAETLIHDPEIDAIYIATPPSHHLHYALAVANAGKPCYVEKPMARSAAECDAMLDAFARAGQPLYVAYYRRALPRFLKVREILAAHLIGEVMAVSHVYQGRANPKAAAGGATGWREDVAASGGGLFVDLGSHVVDVLDFLIGPLSNVTGRAAHRSSGPRVARGAPEDTVVMSFRTESGVLGTARYQFHTAGSMDRLEFVGTRGQLALSVFGQEPLELEVGGERELISVEQPAHVHLPLVQSIVDELGGRARDCASTGRSGARASAVIDRVLDEYYGGRADAFWLRPETWPGVRGAAATR
jgi:1,5-anhydro-D-fructose reductase (1,5-anhydro-D-mannitol-forming)